MEVALLMARCRPWLVVVMLSQHHSNCSVELRSVCHAHDTGFVACEEVFRGVMVWRTPCVRVLLTRTVWVMMPSILPSCFNATLRELWVCSDCALSWWIPAYGKWCSSPVKCCMTQQPCRYCDRCGTDVGSTAAYWHGHGGVVLGTCCEVAEGWYGVPSLEGDFMLVYVVTTLYSLRLRDALQWFLCLKSSWFDDFGGFSPGCVAVSRELTLVNFAASSSAT